MGQEQSGAAAEPAEGGGPQMQLADFQILRAIGKGSFGKVCIVQRKKDRSCFALKYMRKLKCMEKGAFRNVLKEIEILVNLNHPFLVNLWFTFQDSEDMYMVFDLLLGGDLRYHLNQEGRFPEDRVKLYVCEMALALDYLAKQDIVHRDIKPDNIVLDDQGHAHLADFNIATTLEEGCLATSLTGTRPYMAPEIYGASTGREQGYSFGVDWWSLGITMYEMLRGKRPFDLTVHMSCSEAVCVMEETALAIPVDWSQELRDTLASLVQLSPASRVSDLPAFAALPYMARVNFNGVLRKETAPVFIPNQDCLNCDPTFELEEMIVESKPLHKKRGRRSSEAQLPPNLSPAQVEDLERMKAEFKVYNREEVLRNEEARLRKLEEELGLRPPTGEDAIAKRLGRLDSSS